MGSFLPLSPANPAEDFAFARRADGPGDYDCSDDPRAFAHFPHASPAGAAGRAGVGDPLVAAFLKGVAWHASVSGEDG